MRRIHRQCLSYALAFALSFNSVLPLAVAQGAQPPQVEQAEEFSEIIRASEQLPAGQPRGSFAPDRFLLLEQEAHTRSHVGRSFSLFSNRIERDLEEHTARADQASAILSQISKFSSAAAEAQNACAGFEGNAKFSAEAVEKAVVAHINEGRKKDIPLLVWEAQQNPAELACLYERVSTLIKSWRARVQELIAQKDTLVDVPNVTGAPEKELKRYFNWWDLSVSILDKETGEQVDRFAIKKTADHHAIDNTNSYSCNNGDACKVKLIAGNEDLHTLHFPVKTVTTFGPFLVFVHNDSYDAETGVQYLSFMDLATYGPSLGRTEIPVFRLPVVTGEAISSLEVKNQQLIMNGHKQVGVESFMAASELQQIAFNITSNLVEAKDIADVLPYIESLRNVFEKIMATQLDDAASADEKGRQARVLLGDLGEQIKQQILQNKRLAEFSKGKTADVTAEQAAELSEDLKKVLATYGEGLKTSATMSERISRIAARMTDSRKLTAKLDMFFKRIMSPSPNASLKVKRALVMVGAYKNMDQGKFWQFILDRPYLHTTLLAAGVMAAASPSGFMEVVNAGLALGNGMFDYFKFALLGLGEAFVKGTTATAAPFIDGGSSLWKQYVADGNWEKTLLGLSTFVPFVLSLYYIPHLMFNLHKIYLDSKKPGWRGFVQHQRDFVREYYERLAQDEAKRRKLEEENNKKVEFTPDEEAEIAQFVQQRKIESPAYRAPGRIGRLWQSAKEGTAKLYRAMTGSKAVEDGADQHKVKGLWSALMSVTFSYPAMELTLSRWARFWNWFAGTRYSSVGFMTLRDLGLRGLLGRTAEMPVFIRPKPITATVRMLYPDFFTTVVAKRGPKVTLPTELNGGTRTWGMRDLVWLKEIFLGKPSEQRAAEDEVQGELTLSEIKAATESFEAGILDVEDAVYKEAFGAAMRRLPEFLADKKELVDLFTDKALTSVIERRVRDLPTNVRTFIRLYFEEVYQRTMHEYLSNQLAMEDNLNQVAGEADMMSQLSLGQLKQRFIELRKANQSRAGFTFNPAEAQSYAAKHAMDQEIFEKVSKQARKGELSLHNWVMNRKYNTVADMDPEQNSSMKRYSVVQERLKSPNALSRAVRAEISKLLVTFPLDLGFKMLLSAGIFEGAFRPIQNELWGENSIFYLSRDSFYMGMAAGFVMSMMADAWIKIQQDARQDDLGDFGMIPKGQDTTSYFRWYAKQFSAKNNSLMANWGFANKIAFWNMPAALANIGLFYYMFSGRVDLSLLLAGYAVSFGTPISAFYYKVDQAFERSVEYAARGVTDEKWMAHPAIQELISKEKQYYRNRFQMLNDIYLNVQGNWLMNVEVIPTSYGTRGFARSLFNGYLIEEALVEKLFRPLRSATDNIPLIGPAVNGVTGFCEHLLTNGNQDLWKRPGK